MRYQARKKVQWSANNLLTSTSQTQVIKYENKRKKFWFSCILKSFLWSRIYSTLWQVHLNFSNEQLTVRQSEAVTEVSMKTCVFWDVTPCRMMYIWSQLPTFLSKILLPSTGLSQKPWLGQSDIEDRDRNLFWKGINSLFVCRP